MILKNAHLYNADFEKIKADIEVENGIIKTIGENLSGADEYDFSGCVILPGFIDIHTHGCVGYDTTGGNPESAAKMSEWLVTNGVTSFCPTSMTIDIDNLKKAFSYVSDTMGNEKGAYIHGINMEGPFICEAKKGAQAAENILKPDIEVFNTLNSICPVKLVDIAPEVDGAVEFIKQAKEYCTVSAAHSNATYEEGKAGIDAGITHATHLYNAMPPFASRKPGLPGAVIDSESVRAELICDGFHIAPAVLRITMKALGEDRSIVISDSMMAAGMPDGEYSLGGQQVFVKNGDALLADGTIAGSTTNIFAEFKNLLSFGVNEKQVIKSCTINPAKAIGADSFTGSIEEGKNADLLVLSGDMQSIKAVFVKGKKIV